MEILQGRTIPYMLHGDESCAVLIVSFQGVDGKRMLTCPWMNCWTPMKKMGSHLKVELCSLGCAPPSSSSGCFTVGNSGCPGQWPNKLCIMGGTCWNLWTIALTCCVSTTWICIKYCDVLCTCACATSWLECSTACFHEKAEPLVCET